MLLSFEDGEHIAKSSSLTVPTQEEEDHQPYALSLVDRFNQYQD